MAFAVIAGRTGSAEVVVFSDALEKFDDLLKTGALLLFEGEIAEGRGDRERKMSVDRIIPLRKSREMLNAGVSIEVDGYKCEMSVLEKAVDFMKASAGKGRVFMKVSFPSGRVVNAVSRSITVKPDDDVLAGLRSILPESAAVSLSRGDGRYR
jgi:DNA polymerase III alpha subunit